MTRASRKGLIGGLLTAALIAPLAANAAEQDAARFQLERSGDHFVRLDRQTGAMSLCVEQDGNLVCRMAADERAAYETALDRLTERVEALEKTMAADGAAGAAAPQTPTDAQVDRTIGIMEKMMRSFMGIVRQFQEEEQQDKTLPQKTRALYQ